MKKILFYILLFPVFSLLFASCAEEHTTDISEFQLEAFNRWMTKYHPEATKLEGKYAGLYVDWIEQDPDAFKLREGYWFKLNYTARDQDGNIFMTRNKDIAKQMGFYPDEHRLYYVPELIQYVPATLSYSGTYALGQISSFPMIGVGDSLRVYMPHYMGFMGYYGFSYSSSKHYGYSSSSVSIPSNLGLIYDMKITEIIKDINLYETELVQEFARDSLEINNMNDTLASGAYMKKYIENPKGDSVLVKSTAKYYYVGRFLDGYVFDTNVEAIAKENGIKDGDFEPAEADMTRPDLVIGGFYKALLNMQVGEHARVVFVSNLGYGEQGKLEYDTNNLLMPPYTPLEFEIWVDEVEYPETDEE